MKQYLLMFFATVFLTSVLIACLYPMPDHWTMYIEEGGEIFEDFRYKEIEDEYGEGTGKIKILRYNGKGGNVIIPEKIDEMPVTVIGLHAFREKNLNSITIPDSIVSIGGGAFCTNKLTHVTIPDNVFHIGQEAFEYNMLAKIVIPENVTEIYVSTFAHNKLTDVVIPTGVTAIGSGAFEDNELANIVIPDSVTRIGNYAFRDNKLIRISIGANVNIDMWAFEDNRKGFTNAYDNGGKKAGTYTRPKTSSNVWTKQ